MSGSFVKGVVLGSATAAAVVVASGVALAGTGVGAVFNLGQSNTVSQRSVLAGSTAGDQLDVANVNTGSSAKALGVLGKSATAPAAAVANTGGGPALGLTVNAGKSPFTVNSATKVANLNADQLDGLNSSAFTQAGAGTTTILTNRMVLPVGSPAAGVRVLDLPGLGFIFAVCSDDVISHHVGLFYENTSGSTFDYWQNSGADGAPHAGFLPTNYLVSVGSYTDKQAGESFGLGFGEQPGFRRTAFVQFYLFQVTPAAPCGVQVTATLWSSS